MSTLADENKARIDRLREARARLENGEPFRGVPLVISSALPVRLTPGEEARRIVRHGLADVLTWLGEEVGPSPDEVTHAFMGGGVMYVSSHLADRIKAVSRRG